MNVPALPRYERDYAVKSFSHKDKGDVECVENADEVLVPFTKLGVGPCHCITDRKLKSRLLLIGRGLDSLYRQIDVMALSLLDKAVPEDHVITKKSSGYFTPQTLMAAFTMVREHQVEVGAVTISFKDIELFKFWETQLLRWVTDPKEKKKTQAIAFFDEVPIYAAPFMPDGIVLVVSDARFLGAIPIQGSKLRWLKAAHYLNERKLKWGYMLSANLGISVINDYCVAKIKITDRMPKSFQNDMFVGRGYKHVGGADAPEPIVLEEEVQDEIVEAHMG